MRVALLSMMEQAHAGDSASRASLRLGGATLAHHQLLVALALGAERIVCVARYLDNDLIALQYEAERAGAKFNMISEARALSGLITANDDILVMADGLVPVRSDALALIGQSAVILTLPAEVAVPLGYERIDLNAASAGLMLIPGRLVERLNDLPADVDPASSLLRIALQAGVTQRPLSDTVFASGRWLLICTEDQAQSAEVNWMERHTAGRGRTPGLAVAAFAVRRLGAALLHAGSGYRAIGLSAVVAILMAAGLAWYGFFAIAFALCGPAWVVFRASVLVNQIQVDALGGKRSWFSTATLVALLIDVVMIGTLIAAAPDSAAEPLWQRAFAPVILFGLLALVPRAVTGRWTEWLADRLVLSLLLCGLAVLDWLTIGVSALAVLLVFAGVFAPRKAASGADIASD